MRNLFGSGPGSGQDPNTDPNAERTQWSGKHEERRRGYYAALEAELLGSFRHREGVLYLFYFVLFYYPSIW